jgi:hypothetical protein
VIDQGAGGFEAVLHAQTLARLVEVGVDGVLGDVQLAGDLLGRQMPVDQPQTLALTRGQLVDGGRFGLAHKTR